MKIYTKTGDKGTTALVGGRRVEKNHVRIEAYGTADELIAHLAYLRDSIEHKATSDFLLGLLDDLMVASSVLAAGSDDLLDKLPMLSQKSILKLENEIDKLENELPPLNSFILPGGHPAVSLCHVSRTVCRRTERRIYDVMEQESLPEVIAVYFNRLSDYLFVLSRWLGVFFSVDEIKWIPKLDNRY